MRAAELVNHTPLPISAEGVDRLVASVLAEEGADGAVVVAVMSEDEMAELNRHYRGHQEPTDVLSFGYRDDDHAWVETDVTEDEPALLGEVALCPAVIIRDAEDDGKPFSWQMGWALIHGVLHVLGHDHDDRSAVGGDTGAPDGMAIRESELLERLVGSFEGLVHEEAAHT